MDEWAGPLEATVTRQEVWRYLGYRSPATPSGRVEAILEAVWPQALLLLQPRGAYRLVDQGCVTVTGLPLPAGQVAVGLCTIGPRLEQECARRIIAGETLVALLLDGIGSAAAEAAADFLNALVCDAARRRGLTTEPRESPGYGAWDITGQAALLGLLPAEKLGITLTPGLMMTPRKSVSFAVRLTDRPVPVGSRCEPCDLVSCRHRRQAETPPALEIP